VYPIENLPEVCSELEDMSSFYWQSTCNPSEPTTSWLTNRDGARRGASEAPLNANSDPPDRSPPFQGLSLIH